MTSGRHAFSYALGSDANAGLSFEVSALSLAPSTALYAAEPVISSSKAGDGSGTAAQSVALSDDSITALIAFVVALICESGSERKTSRPASAAAPSFVASAVRIVFTSFEENDGNPGSGFSAFSTG